MQRNINYGAAGLLQILVRRKWTGFCALGILLPITLTIALLWPLKYESEIILERKPAKFSPRPLQDEFDISRLTSETQRTVALFKSRFLREHWLESIGIPYKTPQKKENELKRLYRSLTVQPVNYTDLFVIKVKARTPEEASRRTTLLVNLFTEWDADQNRQQAKALIELLQARMQEVKNELAENWNQLKHFKQSQSLSLSGSSREKEIETDIEAKNKLYDTLTMELDDAERLLQSENPLRSKIIAPATTSYKPTYSRTQFVCVAISSALLLALGIVLLVESQDPAIRDS